VFRTSMRLIMETKYILLVLAFAFKAFAAPSNPMITQPAKLAARQFNPGLIGYYSDPLFGYSSLTCNVTNTYTTSGEYARCCSTAGYCEWNTGCDGTRTVLQDIGSGTCYPGDFCTTRTIFDDVDDQNPLYMIGCWSTVASRYPEFYTVVRTPPPSTTTQSSSRSITTTRPSPSFTYPSLPPTSSTSPGTTVPAISTITSPTSTASPSSTGKKNNAWIAAAVIGPILALGILALAFWIYKLRKGKAGPELYPYPPTYPAQPPQSQAYYPPQQPLQPQAYYAPPKIYQQPYPPPQQPVSPPPQPEAGYYNPKTQTPEMPTQR